MVNELDFDDHCPNDYRQSKKPKKSRQGVSSNTSQSFFNDLIIDSFVENDRLVIVKESTKIRDYARGAQAVVTQVVDGDTFTIKFSDNICARVRLLGLDCPEVHYESSETTKKSNRAYCFGEQAQKRTKKSLINKTIYINFDRCTMDMYKRLLLIVYFDYESCMNQIMFPSETGWESIKSSYNYELVRLGYAKSCLYPDNPTFKEAFEYAQAEAEEQGYGAWSACPFPFEK
ncbi:MAG: thermonuclease family protein [Patescibacteria group bacterium]